MSFRHTFITNFLYKHDSADELKAIEEILSAYGPVFWRGSNCLGYFYGVIKNLDNIETRNDIPALKRRLKKFGVRIAVAFE